MIKIATVCSGIGSPEQALKELGIEHEVVFACEKDKYAKQTYLANFKPKQMFEDMTTVDWSGSDKYSDVFIGGIPCQSFSLAGKRLGELDPRGLLFYNFYDYVKIQKPKYFIIENVKGLLSDQAGKTFNNWLELLGQSVNNQYNMINHDDSLLYNLHYTVLNSKNFGVPQNRERVFLVGIRNDLPNTFKFPLGWKLDKRLKDILEPVVDEKYYLSEKMLSYLNNRKDNFNNGKINFKTGEDTESCINASSKSIDISDNIIVEGFINQDTQASQVYGTNGVSPTIGAGTHGYALGYIKEPFCVAMRGRNPDNKNDRTVGAKTEQILEPNSQGITNTITSVQKDNLIVEPKIIQRFELRLTGKLTERDIVPTLKSETKKGDSEANVIHNNRIRRLTPLECFRLQGFDDSFVKPVSDTQQYKQAGNTITVNVIKAILKNLIE